MHEETNPPEPWSEEHETALEAAHAGDPVARQLLGWPLVYDWNADAVLMPPEEPVGLLNATVDAEWTNGSWQLSLTAGGVSALVRGVDDVALRVLIGGSAAKTLIERREEKAA